MAKRGSNGEGPIRLRPDSRWEGRIVTGHKDNGKPIYRSVFAPTQKKLTEKPRVPLISSKLSGFSDVSRHSFAGKKSGKICFSRVDEVFGICPTIRYG